jgi:hypothetical protein
MAVGAESLARRRAALGLKVAVFLLSIATIAAVANYFGQRAALRARFDATKTRAYSLSEPTMRLLESLRGRWTVALLLVEANTDRAMRKQIDEVLRQFAAASDSLDVVRIDPTDPRTLREYERLLADLRLIYSDLTLKYEDALSAGLEAFEATLVFAQQQSGQLPEVLGELGPDDSARSELAQRLTPLELFASQGWQIRSQVEAAVRTDESRPLPDYETARSILSAALTEAANAVNDLGWLMAQWQERPPAGPRVQRAAETTRAECDAAARRAALAADPLRHLAPLELASIGRQLQQGEVALILGPDRAAVVPSAQLIPKGNLQQGDDGAVRFDQRFRGEQVIAAAIRSLVVPRMPLVVFVHAQPGSILRSQEGQSDLTGVASMLDSSRYGVAEWNAATAERPEVERDRPRAWVVIPPPLAERRSVAPSTEEQKLIRAAKELIDDGEPVLLSLYPSALHKFRQPDAWQGLARSLGIEADTSRVVFQSVPVAEDRVEHQRWQEIESFPPEHAITAAMAGQRTRFSLPVPVRPAEPAVAGVRHAVIAAVRPDPLRRIWLETDWLTDPQSLDEPKDEERLRDAVPLAVSVQRPHPLEEGVQRCLVVGSGDWMLTRIADVVMRIGGNRAALVYPGNHELMLASIAWLAGMDELIAASPASRSVARLEDVTDADRRRWFWVIVAGLPAACLLLGTAVWVVRRH